MTTYIPGRPHPAGYVDIQRGGLSREDSKVRFLH